jgi:hypothetical protein
MAGSTIVDQKAITMSMLSRKRKKINPSGIFFYEPDLHWKLWAFHYENYKRKKSRQKKEN